MKGLEGSMHLNSEENYRSKHRFLPIILRTRYFVEIPTALSVAFGASSPRGGAKSVCGLGNSSINENLALYALGNNMVCHRGDLWQTEVSITYISSAFR